MNMFQTKSLVIDMGTAYTKFGFTGDEQPQYSIRSLIGTQKFNKLFRDGPSGNIIDPQGPEISLCKINEIVERGEFVNISMVSDLLEHI